MAVVSCSNRPLRHMSRARLQILHKQEPNTLSKVVGHYHRRVVRQGNSYAVCLIFPFSQEKVLYFIWIWYYWEHKGVLPFFPVLYSVKTSLFRLPLHCAHLLMRQKHKSEGRTACHRICQGRMTGSHRRSWGGLSEQVAITHGRCGRLKSLQPATAEVRLRELRASPAH